MALWRDQLLPRVVDKVCGRSELVEPRRRALTDLHGDVVEIGFGSGHNLAHYPTAVERVLAVEPSMVARRLAERRIAAVEVAVQFVDLDGHDMALPDDCADAAVTTFTLCTVPEVARTLDELRRVVRPGGLLHFLEHGLSPDRRVAAWQHRLTPIQRRVSGGCHFDRPIADLLTAAGFEPVELRNYFLPGPKTPGYIYEGRARPT
jgi:SAM-dependent methyltransferase